LSPRSQIIELLAQGAFLGGIRFPLNLRFQVLLSFCLGSWGDAYVGGRLVAEGAVATPGELKFDQPRLHLDLGHDGRLPRLDGRAILLEPAGISGVIQWSGGSRVDVHTV